MELKTLFVQDGAGNVIPLPTVHVYLPGGTTLATGLQNAAGEALPNPFTGTTGGQIQVAAPDGDYTMRIQGAGRDYSQPVRFIDASANIAAITAAKDAAEAAARDAADTVAVAEVALQGKVDAAQAAAAAAAQSARGFVYPTYAAAKADTSLVEGAFFGIYSADLSKLYYYRKVSGEGELQAVVPYEATRDDARYAGFISRSASHGNRNMPGAPLIDLIAADVLNAPNRTCTVPQFVADKNLLGTSRAADITRSPSQYTVTEVDGDMGVGSDLRLVHLATSPAGFVNLSSSTQYPPGRWTIAFDAVSNTGVNANLRIGLNPGTPVTITPTKTTVWATFVVNDFGPAGSVHLARDLNGATTDHDITVSNLRIVPGNGPGVPSPNVPVPVSRLKAPINNGLLIRSPLGNVMSFRASLGNRRAISAITAMCALRKTVIGGADIQALISSVPGGGNNIGLALMAQLLTGFSAMGNGTALSGMVSLDNADWIIVTGVAGPTGSRLYFNDFLAATDTTPWGGVTGTMLDLMTWRERNDAGPAADYVGMTVWDRALDHDSVIAGVAAYKDRIAGHGQTFRDFRSVYIAEGDSITAGAGGLNGRSWAALLGGSFTPFLQGINFSIAGSTMTNVLTREAAVHAKTREVVASGRRPIMSLLIGINEGLSSNAATDTYYQTVLKPYWARRRAAGAKLMVATVTINNSHDAARQAVRRYLNTLIRSDPTQYDALVDFAANPIFDEWNAAYYGDPVHPNPTGYNLMRDIAAPVMQSLFLA